MMTTPMTAKSLLAVQVRENIDLTNNERQIFDTLRHVLRRFNLQTQIRVAGGWVRDKLLGIESCDIDIALDDMLGREFCEKVNEYLIFKEEKPQRICIVDSNPDKSKHLETAKMVLFGVSIDFVNLRFEEYSEDSRIPTMRFGTAEEDANRRDLTINSLFYNINTSLVEDPTGRGIEDLMSGRIATPIHPKRTFLDDPLRVLRAIRFASRFGFELDEDLKNAATDDDVKAALEVKISRERVGHEIDLMIADSQPVKAVTYISDLKLFSVVFSLPRQFEPPIAGQDGLCVAYMNAAWKLMQLIGCSTLNDDVRQLYLYAALLLPFRKTVYRDDKGKKSPVVSYICLISLKLKSCKAKAVVSLHNAAAKFLSLIPFIVSNEDIQSIEVDWEQEVIDVPVAEKLRILAGLLLLEIKGSWRAALLLSTLLYPTEILCTSSSVEHFKLDKSRELFKTIENAFIDRGLEKIWDEKPRVDGKDVMSELQLKSGGTLVKEWKQKLLQWQLAYPSKTAVESIDWMRESRSKRARTECVHDKKQAPEDEKDASILSGNDPPAILAKVDADEEPVLPGA